MWAPILPPKPGPEGKPNLGNVASDRERAKHSEFALQAEVYDS